MHFHIGTTEEAAALDHEAPLILDRDPAPEVLPLMIEAGPAGRERGDIAGEFAGTEAWDSK